MKRITITILTKDRHSELAIVLSCLLSQEYKEWDLIIADDASGAPITSCYFIGSLINRIKFEGHAVKLLRIPISFGCCYGRNFIIDNDDFEENELVLRLDDDIWFGPDYLSKLVSVIDSGYGLGSGIIPNLAHPVVKRDISLVGDIINKHEFDSEGNLVLQKDDCGWGYTEEKIIPTHQFRTNCLYKREVQKKVKYPVNLSPVAFREEGFFSFGAILEGYKIGVNTGAVCYHLACPSGGNRCQDYSEKVKSDDEIFRSWCKKKFKESFR